MRGTDLDRFLSRVRTRPESPIAVTVCELDPSGLEAFSLRLTVLGAALRDGSASAMVLREIAALEFDTRRAFVVRVEGSAKEHTLRLREAA